MADLFSALPYVVDLDKPVTKTMLYNLFVTTNKKAHRFIITLRRGGVDVPFTGSVVGTLITYSDMMTQEYPGRAEDGKVVFDWPASFYAKSGLFCVIITVDDGEVSNSVFAAEGSMILGETDTLYDPSHVVPSLAELLAQIEATRNAATAANNAANSANTAATDANSAADRANDAAQSIEGMTVSASPGTVADAEITEQDGAKHIHFTLQTGATPNVTFEVATGAPGTQVQVQQSGTAENPVVSLTIPRGDTGAVDGVDYYEGSPSALGTASPGTANGVARGDHVHPMPTAADVGALTRDELTLANVVPDGAGSHNAVYRGKHLGDTVTAEQYASIADGSFRDLFVGDYWTINGANWRIAAFDYYFMTGDAACTTHHATIVPDGVLYTAKMNETNTTTGAYASSAMYTANLAEAKATIDNAFGEAHVLKHRQYLQNAVTDGYASGGSWYDSSVELMTEQNVYGSMVYGNCQNGTEQPDNNTVDRIQYPLFSARPDTISNRAWFWLRDVASASRFARVSDVGTTSSGGASNAGGVRPAFSIIG